jgi:hypothetical protein
VCRSSGSSMLADSLAGGYAGPLTRSAGQSADGLWAMMLYQSYQLWQTERPKTAAERYAAEARRGMFAATESRSAGQADGPMVRPRLRLAGGLRRGAAGRAAHARG